MLERVNYYKVRIKKEVINEVFFGIECSTLKMDRRFVN